MQKEHIGESNVKHGYLVTCETDDEHKHLIELHVIEKSLEKAIIQIRYKFSQALHMISITDCGQVSEAMLLGINIEGGHIIEKS